MTVDRLKLLYTDRLSAVTPEQCLYWEHQHMVLRAVCCAAKEQYTHTANPRSLVHIAISVDAVMAHLPKHFGSPAKPDYRPRLSIAQTLRHLQALEKDGFVGIDDGDFEQIRLRDELFDQLARAVAFRRGIKEHVYEDDHVWAINAQRANQYYLRRCQLFPVENP